MLIKCKFLDENKEPKGRSYAYSTQEDLTVGEIVTTPEGEEVVVTEINVSPEEARGFEDKIKGVLRVIEVGSEPSLSEIDRHDLIVVEQMPVITEKLKLISDEIDEKIAKAKSLPITDETIKTVKTMRASLTKDFTAMEERRKSVKSAVLAPYAAFEEVYKRYVSDKYKSADNDLKKEIERNENARKAEKATEIRAYFEEYALSKHLEEIATWERASIKVGLSDTMKSLKEQAKAFIDRIDSDLQLIETQEHKDEILVEYKENLNASMAITKVTSHHKAIEEQKAKRAEIEAKKAAEAEVVKRVGAVASVASAPLAPPVSKTLAAEAINDNDPVRTLKFAVTAPISKLKDLKKFLDDGDYQYQ